MRAMVLTGIRAMEMREVPDPRIERPADVLIRVGAVGVCGSDIHYYTTGRIGSQVVDYPFAVGHEGAGTVVEVGSAVTRVAPGDRVAIEPAMACGECDQCRAGRANTCRQGRFLGCPGQAEGCLSEFIVMPEACCFPLRDGTSLPRATISEPLAIGVYAMRRAPAVDDAAIGILGLGPIGLTALLAARAADDTEVVPPSSVVGLAGRTTSVSSAPRAIYATDKVPARLAAGRRAGATYAGNPDESDIVAEILECEPPGLDAVFECCGQAAALEQAVELLKPGGALMLIGIPGGDRVSFPAHVLRRKEITLINVRRQEGCVQAALDLIEVGGLDVDPLITHSFPFERTREAFDLVAAYGDGVIKAMIELAPAPPSASPG